MTATETTKRLLKNEYMTWIKLQCRDCDNLNGLEFATGDGDSPLSVIFCGSCSGKCKSYIVRRGYDIELEDYFRKPFCQECDSSENLWVPALSERGISEHVKCLDCI